MISGIIKVNYLVVLFGGKILPVANQYAEIIVNRVVDAIDRVFHYQIPEKLQGKVQLGSVVKIPFGNQELEGVVIGFVEKPEVAKIKDIRAVVSEYPLFNKELIELAYWMADYYICPKAATLQAMLPAGLKISTKNVSAKMVNCAYLLISSEEISQLNLNTAPKQRHILNYLELHNGSEVSQILQFTGASRSSLKALEDKGYVSIVPKEVYRDPYSGELLSLEVPSELTEDQKRALQEIEDEYISNRRPILIHGVTGSGKTEVYLRAIEDMIQRGKQAIVLVPEIALTPQMVAVFKGRLGQKVAVLHSGLSAGERRDAWIHIAKGHVQVVVGARSAVFSPFTNLGIIIIDEEHEQSYKQDTLPRFHARQVAIKRSQLQGAQVVMGSATPSLETYFKASKGEYRLVNLEKRILDRPLPYVEIVDMRQELKNGNKSIFSVELQRKILDRFKKQEQILLFLNRRGFHTFVSCRECGHVLKCPHCEISLTYHAKSDELKCHYCGYGTSSPVICPSCGSKAIRHFGTGTQRVEEEVKKLLPQARVARVDVDTTSQKGAYDRIYRAVRNGEIDILVGTQMIAKGLDFPKVTLVGVISADISLYLPEMRAGERTFQLITQVAGRAGRGEIPGEVILQTYNPEDSVILSAAHQDFLDFYHLEIGKRKLTGYPPYGYMIRVLFTCMDLSMLIRNTEGIAGFIEAELKDDANLLGPAPAPLERIKDRYRYQLVIKGINISEMNAALLRGMEKAKKDGLLNKNINISVDVEPLNMM